MKIKIYSIDDNVEVIGDASKKDVENIIKHMSSKSLIPLEADNDNIIMLNPDLVYKIVIINNDY